MKNALAAAAAACIVLASGPVLGAEKERPLALFSPAVGYACVSAPSSGEIKVVDTPPPPGFKCPSGQKLLVVTKQMHDQLVAAPWTDADGHGSATPPGVPVPPKRTKRRCIPTYGGLYCCSGEPPRACTIR